MRGVFGLLHRAFEKWNYHTARDPFHKLVAEINRNEPQIKITTNCFTVLGCGFTGNIKMHGFLIHRFDLFKTLCLVKGARFEIWNDQVIYFIGNLKLRITTPEELFIVYEILVQNIYSIEVPEGGYIMVDVGMNVGVASLFFASNPAVKKVFAFEPFEPTFSDAMFNFQLNHSLFEKIEALNFGLGLKDETLNVAYSSLAKGKNSIYNGIGELMQTIKIRNALTQIELLIQKHPQDSFYMKIDCEGAEFDIFESFHGKALPENIKGILMEWHEEYPSEIVNYLKSNSFKLQQRSNTGIGFIVAFR